VKGEKLINVNLAAILWRQVAIWAATDGIQKKELLTRALESYLKEEKGWSSGADMVRGA